MPSSICITDTNFTDYLRVPYAGSLYNANKYIGESDLTNLPDLSFWKDRSVLVLTLHYLNITSTGDNFACPKLYICASPQMEVFSQTKTKCFTGLGYVSFNLIFKKII